jgi:hypothetical protein
MTNKNHKFLSRVVKSEICIKSFRSSNLFFGRKKNSVWFDDHTLRARVFTKNERKGEREKRKKPYGVHTTLFSQLLLSFACRFSLSSHSFFRVSQLFRALIGGICGNVMRNEVKIMNGC